MRFPLPITEIVDHRVTWWFTQLPVFAPMQNRHEVQTQALPVDFLVSVQTSPGTWRDLEPRKAPQ
jgi:hypothetical protein